MKYFKYAIFIVITFGFIGCVENINIVEGDFNTSNETHYKNLEEAFKDGAITKEEYDSIKLLDRH